SALVQRSMSGSVEEIIFQRQILGVPPLGRSESLSAVGAIRGQSEAWLGHENGPAARGPSDDAKDTRRHGEAVQRRRRADEDQVHVVRQESLNGRGSCVEDLRLDREFRTEGLLQRPL